ncbi:MAG: hypothetical protein HY297_05855 [Thaumarchaeota archaeon]|nr:hypothetical protein [Nitrososphaerota archaeon]
MSAVASFFRHCPSCGKRFHVKRVGEKLVGEEIMHVPSPDALGATLSVNDVPMGRHDESGVAATAPDKTDSKVVEVEEIQYTFRCEHCGHEWTEYHAEEVEVKGGAESGYTGD